MRTRSSRPQWLTALLVSSALFAVGSCGSDEPKTDASTTGDATVGGDGGGGPVAGMVDNHCMGKKQATSQAVCKQTAPDGGADAGDSDDPNADYGPTMYNAEGDDDDCKYHVKFSSTTIAENTDVTLTVTFTNTTDGQPTTGAALEAEVFLDMTHPAPSTGKTTTTEISPGKYTIGPVRFDKPGRWTVRYHAFEDCTDFSEESPHGHAAFYIDVP